MNRCRDTQILFSAVEVVIFKGLIKALSDVIYYQNLNFWHLALATIFVNNVFLNASNFVKLIKKKCSSNFDKKALTR